MISPPNETAQTKTPETTSSANAAYTAVAELTELDAKGQITKWVEDHDLVIFLRQGKVKVMSNICPHFGGPIGYHQVKDDTFTCLWHNIQFSADNGKCKTHPNLCIREYASKVENGKILVRLTENTHG